MTLEITFLTYVIYVQLFWGYVRKVRKWSLFFWLGTELRVLEKFTIILGAPKGNLISARLLISTFFQRRRLWFICSSLIYHLLERWLGNWSLELKYLVAALTANLVILISINWKSLIDIIWHWIVYILLCTGIWKNKWIYKHIHYFLRRPIHIFLVALNFLAMLILVKLVT